MKTPTKLITLFTTLLLFSNCTKDECHGTIYNLNVDRNYLPYIIPYSDTSTRLFLKNGKDTLLFKSKGLLTGSSQQVSGEEGCDTYNLEWLSLTMAASDTDYFQINYYATKRLVPYVNFAVKSGSYYTQTEGYAYDNFKYYITHPPILKVTILNNVYDSVRSLPDNNIQELYLKPNTGILKIKTAGFTYELIK